MDFKQSLFEKFEKYVKIDTTSDSSSKTVPSTEKQLELANLLKADLEDMGLKKVKLSDAGHLTAELPANTDKEMPKIGFLAHMDTVEDYSGTNVKPQLHKNYDGGRIVINEEKNMVLDPAVVTDLKHCKGHDIVTTDGTTLLGGDDKAGIAIIMTMLEYYIENPKVKHGTIKVAFTIDEEIGTGINTFDIDSFGADFAYTIDGDTLLSIENGNFNADMATITITGYNTHPGSAKDKMENPVRIGSDIISAWPVQHLPETTEKEEGFILFKDFEGNLEKAVLGAIIREHDMKKLAALEDKLKAIIADMQKKYPKSKINLEIKEQYRNMRDVLLQHPEAMDRLEKVMTELNIPYKVSQIRGGTDGARLTLRGLPCPNIFAGYNQAHGPYEWASLDWMSKLTEVAINIVKE
ncbi:tripeptide aminopeptidase [Parelusimicrobium proximum]|uniref:peptidase T n=1 Tax=Parelusimicrobium proximum TaxID=3228953 RepID=UPI003D165559